MTTATVRRGEDRILTVPNVITVVRLLCIPVFLWLLFVVDDQQSAAWLLGGLGATDWVDGFVARRFDQVSELGKVLDPTADRIVFIVCVTAIVIDGSAPLGISLLVITREVVVGVTMAGLTLFWGMKRFDVQWVGKVGTFCLMFAFPFWLMGSSDAPWADLAWILGWGFGLVGVVFSLYSAVTYVPLIRRALSEGREVAPS
jgi:cardiolipin synthase